MQTARVVRDGFSYGGILFLIVLLHFACSTCLAYEKRNSVLTRTIAKNPLAERFLKVKYGEEKAKSLRLSTTAKSNRVGTAPSASGFLIYQQYFDQGCQGKDGMTTGLATDVCFAVTDLDDNSTIGYGSYHFDSVKNGKINYHMTVFSDECSTPVEQVPLSTLEGCIKPVDDEASWYSMGYTTNTEVYSSLGAGLLVLPYDTEEHCETSDVYGQFTHQPLNVCIRSDDSEYSYMLQQCDVTNKMYTEATFNDGSCADFHGAFTSPLEYCTYSPDVGDDYDTENSYTDGYYTYTCQ